MTTKENQSENMETQTTKSMEKPANKSILISLAPGAADLALKIIHYNKVSYTLLGNDQHEATILQVSYAEEQQPGVNDLLAFLKFFESFVQVLTAKLQPFCEAFSEELQKAFYKLKVEHKQKKIIKAAETTNMLSDGNEERK